jgi:hypothetical protein
VTCNGRHRARAYASIQISRLKKIEILTEVGIARFRRKPPEWAIGPASACPMRIFAIGIERALISGFRPKTLSMRSSTAIAWSSALAAAPPRAARRYPRVLETACNYCP